MHSHINIIITTLLLLTIISHTQIIDSYQPIITLPKLQPCISYQSGNCIACPYNYHTNQNQCFLNITNCITYVIDNLGQQSCDQCDATVSVSDGNGGCSTIQSQLTTVIVSTTNLQTVAQQYGDSRFQIIPLQSAMKDPFFIRCNNFMLNGQYSHFISRIAQAINAVSFFTLTNQNQYKILYYGSGGGLMMCIITISTSTNAFQLNSFVPIGTTNVIDFCGLYNEALQCVACIIGYHLQGNQCYVNVGGCISYSQNICLQCGGFALLVQNRCVGCDEMGDTSKILFWGALSTPINTNSIPFATQNYLL